MNPAFVLSLVLGAAEPAAEVTTPVEPLPEAAKAPAKAVPEEDPYLLNYKKFEHRDARAPGRGPQGKKIGFGLSLGRPLAVSAKIYFTQTVGFQADVGGSYSWNGPELSIQGHLVWHPYTLVSNDTLRLSVYVGGGGRAALWPAVITGIPAWMPACRAPCKRPAFLYAPGADSFPGTLGLQALAGMDLQVQKLPLEFFVQPVVTLEVFPGLSGDLGAQVGGRWYFF